MDLDFIRCSSGFSVKVGEPNVNLPTFLSRLGLLLEIAMCLIAIVLIAIGHIAIGLIAIGQIYFGGRVGL